MPPEEYLSKGPIGLRGDRTDPVESSLAISCKCGIGEPQVAETRSVGGVGADGVTREAINRSPPPLPPLLDPLCPGGVLRVPSRAMEHVLCPTKG